MGEETRFQCICNHNVKKICEIIPERQQIFHKFILRKVVYIEQNLIVTYLLEHIIMSFLLINFLHASLYILR